MRIWMILVAVLLAVPVGAAEKDRKNPLNPTGGGHFEVVDPAEKLAPDKAERIYRRLRPRLRAAYALSADRTAGGYAKWRRFNRAPYESKQHGGRYLSNYGNQAAQAYGRFEKAGKLPPGAIIAKDSSSVGKDGQVLPGPLFIMEKMAPGFDKASGDWRYSQIMPDGSTLGVSKGPGAENVGYCGPCHARVARRDHLFFIPRAYRLGPAE